MRISQCPLLKTAHKNLFYSDLAVTVANVPCFISSVAYSSADVGHRLAETLDGTIICWKCGSACLLPYAQYSRCIDLRQVSSSVTAVDTRGSTRAPCSAALCSASCAARVTIERRSNR